MEELFLEYATWIYIWNADLSHYNTHGHPKDQNTESRHNKISYPSRHPRHP